MLKLHGGLLRFSQISTRFMETFTVLVALGNALYLDALMIISLKLLEYRYVLGNIMNNFMMLGRRVRNGLYIDKVSVCLK